MTTTIIPERLAALYDLRLDRGSHVSWDNGHCAAEVGSWLCGEPHGTRPSSWSYDITQLFIGLNDTFPDAVRQELLPFIPTVCGTADDGLTKVRWRIGVEWLVDRYIPWCLRHLGYAPVTRQRRTITGWRDVAGVLATTRDLVEHRLPDVPDVHPQVSRLAESCGIRVILRWLTIRPDLSSLSTSWASHLRCLTELTVDHVLRTSSGIMDDVIARLSTDLHDLILDLVISVCHVR